MSEPIATIKTTTEIVKTTAEVVNPDSVTEIIALQNSDDPRLQNAGNYEADTKQKIAETKNFIATIAHGGLVVPLKKVGGAVIKIAESFSLHSESTKNAINKKVEQLKQQGILSGEISSIPAFADMAERLVYLDNEPDLKKMFEDLLISTIDSTKTNINHPAYVEVLKQIDNQEAINLKLIFQDCHTKLAIANINFSINEDGQYIPHDQYQLAPPYSDITRKEIENWERLKLIDIEMDIYLTDDSKYKYIEDEIAKVNETLTPPQKLELVKGTLSFTEFGKNFAKAVGIIE
ncbi:MAG: DUF4393 domain-containing protein [Aggregatibacter segnis]|uniref:DUF4393 domain-containing protein n=1 Tax=Aggregatibacter segnis TaxID=739 RepID=UPI003FA03422